MADTELLSIRAYARHRGVTDGAVRKALERGRITTEPSGRINPATADAEWDANTRAPVRTEDAGTHEGTHPGTRPAAGCAPPGEVRTELEGQPHGGALKRVRKDETHAEADRRKAVSLANQREMEEAEKARELVSRRAVAAAWFTTARAARDQMLVIPDRVAERAGLTLQQRDVLMEELRLVLRGLAGGVPGTGDPLPAPVVL